MTLLHNKIDKLYQLIENKHIESKLESKNTLEISSRLQLPPDLCGIRLRGQNKELMDDVASKLETKLKIINLEESKEKNSNKGVNIAEPSTKPSVNMIRKEFGSSINMANSGTYKKMNKVYYPRPSPLDVLIEEEENWDIHYGGDSIVEWNIYGKTDGNIYKIAHHMLMFSSTTKATEKNERYTAQMIVVGFTGQLKGWWDNYLTGQQRAEIHGSVITKDG